MSACDLRRCGKTVYHGSHCPGDVRTGDGLPLNADLQAYQGALYETTLEHGLSRDDLEYAFGEDFVTEMENREQMQQAEKNNDDLNLE